MTDQEVWSQFCSWLGGFLGVKAIKANLSEDRPALPYVMVNMPTIREVRQQAEDIVYEETGEETPEGKDEIRARPIIETEWMFSIHAYGDTPTDLLRPIVTSRHVDQYALALGPALTLFDVSEIRRIPEFINNRWEPRAQVDVFLRGIVNDGLIVDTIETYSFDINRES